MGVQVALYSIQASEVDHRSLADRSAMFKQAVGVVNTAGMTLLDGAKKVFIAPEYFFSKTAQLDNGETLPKPVSWRKKRQAEKFLKQVSADNKDTLFVSGSIYYKKFGRAYNVCPVLLNGEIIQKIYKDSDDGVTGHVSKKTRWGTKKHKQQPVVKVGDITMGIDICLDYNNDKMRQHVQGLPEGQTEPDWHIQISGSNPAQPSRCFTKDYYLHCDHGARGASAFRKAGQIGENARMKKIQERHQLDLESGGRLNIVDIDASFGDMTSRVNSRVNSRLNSRMASQLDLSLPAFSMPTLPKMDKAGAWFCVGNADADSLSDRRQAVPDVE